MIIPFKSFIDFSNNVMFFIFSRFVMITRIYRLENRCLLLHNLNIEILSTSQLSARPARTIFSHIYYAGLCDIFSGDISARYLFNP